MKIEDTAIADVKIIHLNSYSDSRGMFVETFDTRVIQNLGLENTFVQDATSVSATKGTFRGLHFQKPPPADLHLSFTKGNVINFKKTHAADFPFAFPSGQSFTLQKNPRPADSLCVSL